MKSKALILNPIALSITIFFAASAHAVGTGQIAIGSGAINKNQGGTVVNQNTDKMIINWDNMNVGQKESLQFIQPNKNASVLNKVSSLDPTIIQGSLNANGKVFIVNPNGILISNGAKVNVGSLIASSLDIKESDFMNDNIYFAGKGTGKVSNEGTITADDSIAMVGADEVSNTGKMLAVKGNVTLASGDNITLSFPSMGKIKVKINKGSLKALVKNGGIISTPDGSIALTAWATDTLTRNVINNTGTLEANQMIMSSDGIYLKSISNGNVDISGKITGNKINASANNINVGNGALLKSNYHTQLTANKKDGYVKFGKSTLEGTQLGINADNVLSGNNADDLRIVNAQQVNIKSGSKNLTIGKSEVFGYDPKKSGEGVINANVINSISTAKGRLTVTTEADNVNLSNSDLNYGDLTITNTSDKGNLNLLSSVKGDNLVINTGKKFIQSQGAEVNMAHGFAVVATEDIGQNNNITAGDYISITSTKGDITQKQGVKSQARGVSYSGKNIRIDGHVSSQDLLLDAYQFTQGGQSSLNADFASLSNGEFDLTAGKNSLEQINLNAKTLSLKTISDTAFIGGSYLEGNLLVDSKADVKFDDLTVGGLIHVDANNIRDSSNYNSTIRSGKDIVLTANNEINLKNIVSGESLLIEGLNIQALSIDSGANSTISSRENLSIGNVASRNDNYINAGKNLKIHGYLFGENIDVFAHGIVDMYGANSFGDFSLIAGQDVNIYDNLYSHGELNISGKNINVVNQFPWYQPAITSNKNLTLNATDTISVGNLTVNRDGYNNTSPGNIYITGNDITTKEIRADGGSLSLISGGNVKTKDISVRNDLNLSAKNDIELKNLSASNIDINAKDGSVSLYNVNSDSDTSIYSSKSVLIDGDVISEGSLKIVGESITAERSNGWYASKLSSIKDMILNAKSYLNIGDISTENGLWGFWDNGTSGNIYMTGSDIIAGNITSTGDVIAKAGNNIMTKIISAEKRVEITADKDVNFSALSALNDLKISSGKNIFTDRYISASDIDINSKGNITLTGINSKNNLSITAGGGVEISQKIEADKKIHISASNINVYSNSWIPAVIQSGNDTELNSTGDINIGDVSAGSSYGPWGLTQGSISLVGKNIDVGKLSASGDITILSEDTIEAKMVDANNIGLLAKNNINIDNVTGTESVTATSSQGKISFETLNLTRQKDISAEKGVTIKSDLNETSFTQPNPNGDIGQGWNQGWNQDQNQYWNLGWGQDWNLTQNNSPLQNGWYF